MSNNKVRSPLTDMINICMTLYEILLINLDLLALILSNLSIQYKNFHWGQYDKNQSYTDIFRIGPTAVRPITARSESTRRFDNRKEKSQ